MAFESESWWGRAKHLMFRMGSVCGLQKRTCGMRKATYDLLVVGVEVIDTLTDGDCRCESSKEAQASYIPRPDQAPQAEDVRTQRVAL